MTPQLVLKQLQACNLTVTVFHGDLCFHLHKHADFQRIEKAIRWIYQSAANENSFKKYVQGG